MLKNPFSLSREAVRILTAVTIIAQVVAYVATEVAGLNSAGQLTIVALLGVINAAARKFVYSEETVDEIVSVVGLPAAPGGCADC